MASRKAEIFGLLLGTVAGVLAVSLWKESKLPKDGKQVDTGNKTLDGKPIVEVTGVGGDDNGVKVQGYILPSNIDEIKLPLTVIVKPNKNLFLTDATKAGEKIIFTQKLNDELKWIGVGSNGEVGEYMIWLPTLIDKSLGVA